VVRAGRPASVRASQDRGVSISSGTSRRAHTHAGSGVDARPAGCGRDRRDRAGGAARVLASTGGDRGGGRSQRSAHTERRASRGTRHAAGEGLRRDARGARSGMARPRCGTRARVA
jgi:hypothetical protein